MFKRILPIIFLLMLLIVLFLGAPVLKEYPLATTLLPEASGLAASITNPGILYSHNDSGGANEIYAIDGKGNFRARIVLDGVKNRDWEDIATVKDPHDGKAYIYVGEIGDNRSKHDNVWVYRVAEPLFSAGDSLYTATDFDRYKIRYEDGARDAEAFFTDPKSGDIYIIGKREEKVGVYRVKYPQSTSAENLAKKVGQMQMGWVTAADISPNGKYLLVKNYLNVRRFKLGCKRDIGKTLSQKGKDMPYKLEPQGEAICWDAKGKGYFTLSEKTKDAVQILYYYK